MSGEFLKSCRQNQEGARISLTTAVLLLQLCVGSCLQFIHFNFILYLLKWLYFLILYNPLIPVRDDYLDAFFTAEKILENKSNWGVTVTRKLCARLLSVFNLFDTMKNKYCQYTNDHTVTDKFAIVDYWC